MADRSGPHQEGYVLLSHSKAARLRIWDTLEEAMRSQLIVNGRVTERTKGGLMLDVGVPAFMPGSQIDTRPIHDLDQFVGQDLPVRIVKVNRRRGNVVVSRRMAVEEDRKSRKSSVLENISEGSSVTGIVKNLTDYGAFIDLGGIDGLLHVSDMSHGRVSHPSQVLQAGQEVTCKVLKFDRDKERISLGIRQMTPDPWETMHERLLPGERVVGRVMSVTDYGAFVEIEPGVEGLIHVSEMTWSRRMKHPTKVVKAGDEVEAVVLEVKQKDRRVSLGIKQLEADPWTTVSERYSIGSVVEGRIRKLTDFGAFLEIEEGVDGLVHVSDGDGEERADPASRNSQHRCPQSPPLAGHQAVAARCLGKFLPYPRSGRFSARPSRPRGCVRRLHRDRAGRRGPVPQIGGPGHAHRRRCIRFPVTHRGGV
jgi:small subunit ribosomal protein S1